MSTLQTTTHVGDLLDSLQPERPEEEKRTLEVKPNTTLDKLLQGFEELVETFRSKTGKIAQHLKAIYSSSGDIIRRLDITYSLDDISQFFLTLPEYEKEDNFHVLSGIYLSALSNTCEEEGVLTFHSGLFIKEGPYYLGFRNRRDLVIIGSACNVGNYMSKGTITVQGDTWGEIATGMSNGTLLIQGKVIAGSMSVGYEMRGGNIIVEKETAPTTIGQYMRGGTITFHDTVRTTLLAHGMEQGQITIHGVFEGGIKNLGENARLDFLDDGFTLDRKFLSADYHSVQGTICHKGVPVFQNGRYLQ